MEDIHKLILLVKEYIHKQKEELTLSAAERLIKFLSAAIVGAIILSIVCLVALLCSVAFAIWISKTYFNNEYHIGLAITSAILLLFILIIWLKRNSWIIQPVARYIVKNLLADQQETNTNNGNKNDNTGDTQ
ncbi:MAG: hypothetical protein IKU79_05225 [Bacteroidaceae bacterium]|nr:hypothetical protein [Bacteroidaceae bacterium]